MGIEMIGIDHSVAEIDIRTIFSFTKKQTEQLLRQVIELEGIEGCVLLSTCNRMELWVSTSSRWKGDLYEILCAIREVPAEIYAPYFSRRNEQEAVQHLFWLASGLRSRILGEDQILTQVGEALSFARQCYATDHVLETLFRQAVTGAKKVKTDVVLSSGDVSVVHTAFSRLQQMGLSLKGKRCLVIGNGVMGKLAAELLMGEQAHVTVTVRQYRSGLVDIPAGCERIDYGRRMEVFASCDIVVSATASPNYTLTYDLVKDFVHKPMVLIDLAVPRDMDPKIGTLPDVKMFDVDSFRADAYGEEQLLAMEEAKQLLQQQMEDFFSWYHCVDIVPDIQKLKAQMAQDVMCRLEKTWKNTALSKEDAQQLQQEVEAAAQRAANKMLFGLKKGLDTDTLRSCMDCMKAVYENE